MLFQSAGEEEEKLDVFYNLDKENGCVSQQGTGEKTTDVALGTF